MEFLPIIRTVAYFVVFVTGGYTFVRLLSAFRREGVALPVTRSLAIIMGTLSAWVLIIIFVVLVSNAGVDIGWAREWILTLPVVIIAGATSVTAWSIKKRSVDYLLTLHEPAELPIDWNLTSVSKDVGILFGITCVAQVAAFIMYLYLSIAKTNEEYAVLNAIMFLIVGASAYLFTRRA